MKSFLIILFIFFVFNNLGFSGETKAYDIKNSWAIRNIEMAVAAGISPYIDLRTKFQPKSHLNRGELAVLLCRILPNEFEEKRNYTEEYNAVYYFKNQKPGVFKDFKSSEYFGYVERAIDRKVIPPINTKYNPYRLITRGEFIKSIIIALEKTDDPDDKIDGIAHRAYELNKHLTRIQDVSVVPAEFPGWIKTAQEYNLVPKRPDDDPDIEIAASRYGIPYKWVFYNPITKEYEFDEKRPITKELAMAIVSNLFVKWDYYGLDIPYDAIFGNKSLRPDNRMCGLFTKDNAQLLNIDVQRNFIEVKANHRIIKNKGKNVLETIKKGWKNLLFVPEEAKIWLNYAGKWLDYSGKNKLIKLKNTLSNIKNNNNLFDLRVNIITQKMKYSKHNEMLETIRDYDNNIKKIQRVAYMEIFAIPFDYHGRILAIREEGIQIVDFEKGKITLYFDKNSKIERKILSDNILKNSFDLLLTPNNKYIYDKPFEALKIGEEVYIKVGNYDKKKVLKVISFWRRIGKPIQFNLKKRLLMSDETLNSVYSLANYPFSFEKYNGLKSFILNRKRSLKLEEVSLETALLPDGSLARNRIIYVQPSDIEPIDIRFTNRIDSKIENLIALEP